MRVSACSRSETSETVEVIHSKTHCLRVSPAALNAAVLVAPTTPDSGIAGFEINGRLRLRKRTDSSTHCKANGKYIIQAGQL